MPLKSGIGGTGGGSTLKGHTTSLPQSTSDPERCRAFLSADSYNS
jgi:hypothetical protein